MTEGNVGALNAQIGLDARELDAGVSKASRAFQKLSAGEGILKQINFQLQNFANATKAMERSAGALSSVATTLKDIGKSAKALKSLEDIGPALEKGGAALSAFAVHLQALGAARPSLQGIKQDLREIATSAQSVRIGSATGGRASRFELPRGAGIPLGPALEDLRQVNRLAEAARVRSIREIPAREPFLLPGQARTLPSGHPVVAASRELDAQNRSRARAQSLQAQLLHLQGKSVAALRIEQELALKGVKTAAERNAIQAIYNERIKQAQIPLEQQSQAWTRIVGMMQRAAAAYLLFKTGQFLADVIKTSVTLEGMPIAFQAITGSAGQAQKEMAFIRSEADRLGLEILSLGDSWKKFSAASQGLLGLENARTVFSQVAGGITVMRLSGEEATGTFRNLAQIASKGTLSFEELRDMSEHFPGAFELFAVGVGKTTVELRKMIKAGAETGGALKVDLIKFGEQFERKFGKDVPAAAQGSQAALNKFSNAILEAKVAIGSGGFLDATIDGIKKLTTELSKPESIEGMKALGKIAGLTTVVIFSVATGALKFLDVLGQFEISRPGAQQKRADDARLEALEQMAPRFVPRGGWQGLKHQPRATGRLYEFSEFRSRLPNESILNPGQILNPILPPAIDEKAARATQMSLERTLDLRRELLLLQKKGIEALEVEREHDLAAARRRQALPIELSAINALHVERIKLFKEESEREAGGIRTVAIDPFPEIYAQERSLRKILAERAGDQQGIVDILDEEIGLLQNEASLMAGQSGLLGRRIEVEGRLNDLLQKREGLQRDIWEAQVGQAQSMADILATQREQAEGFQDIMLGQARFQFGRGEISRQDLLGQLAQAQERAEEEWLARPTPENLRKVVALNQEQADLTVDIWFEAQQAIADNWIQVVEGAENMGEALIGVFKDIGRNISRILIQDVSQGMVNALKKSLSGGAGGKGMASAIGDLFKGGSLSSILQAASGGLAKIWGAIKGGVFGAGPTPGGVPGPNTAPSQGIPDISGATISSPGGTMPGWAGGAMAIGSVAGQMIGGRAGGIISGAASGAMLGTMILPGIGTAIGAVAGGIIGGITGGKNKGKDPIRAAIKQWVEQEWRPAWREMEAMGFGRGIFEGVSSSAGIKALGWGKGIPQEALSQMKKSVESLKEILSTALSDGFKASTAARGFDIFLRNIRKGIADYVTEGLIEAALKSKALTKLFAPLFEEIPKVMAGLLKGGTFQPGAFQQKIMGLWKGLSPALDSLEGFFGELFGAAREFKTIGRPQGSLWASIPSQFLSPGPMAETNRTHRAPDAWESLPPTLLGPAPTGRQIPGGAGGSGRTNGVVVPITIYATVNSPMDAKKMAREAADEIERELRRVS